MALTPHHFHRTQNPFFQSRKIMCGHSQNSSFLVMLTLVTDSTRLIFRHPINLRISYHLFT
jgi:hypothetical protein